MKKSITILLAFILTIAMMPLTVFAEDSEIQKTYGSDEPRIEIDAEDLVFSEENPNAVFGDNPYFTVEDTLGREAEDYGIMSSSMYGVRIKTDGDVHLSIKSKYNKNLYLGVWRRLGINGAVKAVEIRRAVGTADAQRSLDLNGVKTNDVFTLVIALCGDYGENDIQLVNVGLELTVEPQVEDVSCVHVPHKITKCAAECGFDGWKTHWECQDCYEWLIKDKKSGEYRKMTKAEKKSYTLKMPAKKHKFNKKIRNASTRKCKANCTHAAEYYYSCKYCGAIGSKTFKYGKKLGHKFKKNYTIAATYGKVGKTGTICTRCNKVKKGTKVTLIPQIEEALLLAEPWIVGPEENPKFSVTVNGKKISSKEFSVSRDYGEYSDDGVRMVMATATLKGKYDAVAFCMYFQFDHEPTDEERTEWEAYFKQIEEQSKSNEEVSGI